MNDNIENNNMSENQNNKQDIMKQIVKIIVGNQLSYSEAEEILYHATKYLKKTKLNF